MRNDSVVMLRKDRERLREVLSSAGIAVEPHRAIGGLDTVRCSRAGFGVLVSTSQPPHWARAQDERKNLVVVAAMRESLLAFLRWRAETKLRDDVIAALRPLEWKPPGRAG